MGLLDRLRELGTKLRIIEVRPANAPTPPRKVAMRALTMAQLDAEVRADDLRVLAGTPAELDVPFEKVFAAGGVPHPANGWTAERLAQVLHADSFARLSRSEAQRALAELLAKERVTVEELVKDAVARDQTLDKYASFARKKLDDRATARRRREEELQARQRELEAQLARVRAEDQADRDAWAKWRKKKLACEKDLAWALGFLLDKPLISVDEEPRGER